MDPKDERKEPSDSAIGTQFPTFCEDSEAVQREQDAYLETRIQNFRDSERLSESDFAIRINVRD